MSLALFQRFSAWQKTALIGGVLVALLPASTAACSSSSSGGDSNASTPSCPAPAVAIDRFKELMVVDDSVIGDPRSQNSTDGVWSFRHMMEELAGPGADAGEFTSKWIQTYATGSTVDGYTVPARALIDEGYANSGICPWLLETPSNQCDAQCGTCAAKIFDLSKAPFRLLAIVNRLDLSAQDGQSGESRLVFGYTNGPGDLPSSTPQNMTVIFEFRLQTDATHGLGYWSNRWHSLGAIPQFGADYNNALADLVAEFAVAGGLGQVRTNERVFDWQWSLRQFSLTGGQLVPAATQNTPDFSLNASPALTTFVQQNQQTILGSNAKVPTNMLGGDATILDKWTVLNVSEQLRSAFAAQTCNGCHGVEHPAIDTAFHVSPFETGIARLSTFLNNPADPTNDELARRTISMQNNLCVSP